MDPLVFHFFRDELEKRALVNPTYVHSLQGGWDKKTKSWNPTQHPGRPLSVRLARSPVGQVYMHPRVQHVLRDLTSAGTEYMSQGTPHGGKFMAFGTVPGRLGEEVIAAGAERWGASKPKARLLGQAATFFKQHSPLRSMTGSLGFLPDVSGLATTVARAFY